jgi:membrane fusion protein (multidrug efflux system)
MPPLICRICLLLSVLAGLVSACSDDPSVPAGRGGAGPEVRPPTVVVTAAAQLRTIRNEVEAIGTARANESVTITAKVTDTVSRVNFEDGALVQQGDVLLELSNSEDQALLAEAAANVKDARTQLDRLENLLLQQSVPVSQVDEARARFAAAEARQQSVAARLGDRLIRAPFSGLLGFRQVSEGTMITPGTAITTLDDVSVIKLDFSVPETYLNLLRPGMALAAQSVAYPGRSFDATVRTIGSRIDPVTRSATVRAHIDNVALLLRAGMLLTVRLTTAQRQVLMVPEDALVQRGDQVYVFTVQDGVADTREVQHGDRYQGWVEIVSGLEPGDSVITEGVIKVRPGVPVRVAGSAADSSAARSAVSGSAGAGDPAGDPGGDPGL